MKWTPLQYDEVKWLGIDWDDTIVKNSGFPDFIPTEPIPGAVNALHELVKEGYKIVIYTARPWSDYHNIEKMCEEHNIPARRIICGKPLFKWIIDDKNIEYRTSWSDVLQKIKSKQD